MTNPLSHALDDAADGPEARAYTVPVAAVRRLARRRRAWRTTGTAALALVLVIGGGGAVQAAISALRDTGHASSGGDWPAQFGRCGQSADGLLPDTRAGAGTGALTVQINTVVTASGEATVLAETVVDLPDAPGVQGWVYGTDLSVVRDGVVVGVQEGAQVPDVADAVSYYAGAAYPLASFPQPVVVQEPVVSCEQYPSGTGSTTLAAGSYTLVVTQTVGYVDADGVTRAARASAQTPLTVPVDQTSTQPASATDCGASDEALAALADPESNPAPVAIRALTADSVSSAEPFAFGAAAVNSGAGTLEVRSSAHDTVVLTQGGVVVASSQVGPSLSATTLAPGESLEWHGPAVVTSCADPSGEQRASAGTYQLWLAVDLDLDGTLTTVAGGPWPITLRDEAPAPQTTADPASAPTS